MIFKGICRNSIKIPLKAFSYTHIPKIPLLLDGVGPLSSQQSKKIIHGQELLKLLFDDQDVKSGIELAYKAYIESLVQNDTGFFEETCEPKFCTTIKDSLSALKKQNFRFQASEQSIDTNKIVPVGTKFFLGIRHNRLENKYNDIQRIQMDGVELEVSMSMGQNLNSNQSKLQLFDKGGFGFGNLSGLMPKMNFPRILQIQFFVEATGEIELLDANGVVLKKSDKVHNHLLQLEIPNENNLNLVEILGLAAKLVGKSGNNLTAGKVSDSDMQQTVLTFKNLIITDDFEWKISDVDSILNGNNF